MVPTQNRARAQSRWAPSPPGCPISGRPRAASAAGLGTSHPRPWTPGREGTASGSPGWPRKRQDPSLPTGQSSMRLELGVDTTQGHAQEGGVTMSIVTSWVTHVWQGEGAALPCPGAGRGPARQCPSLCPFGPWSCRPPPCSAGPSPRLWLCVAPTRPPSWGGPGTHRAPAGSSAGHGPPLTACLSWCQPGSEWVPCGEQSGCGSSSQVQGCQGGGTSAKRPSPPSCGASGQPVVPALGPGARSGPLCLGRGASWGLGLGLLLVAGSCLRGDGGARCPSSAGLSLHPSCPRRGVPCRDRLSGFAVLCRRDGCKEGHRQASGARGSEGHPGPAVAAALRGPGGEGPAASSWLPRPRPQAAGPLEPLFPAANSPFLFLGGSSVGPSWPGGGRGVDRGFLKDWKTQRW